MRREGAATGCVITPYNSSSSARVALLARWLCTRVRDDESPVKFFFPKASRERLWHVMTPHFCDIVSIHTRAALYNVKSTSIYLIVDTSCVCFLSQLDPQKRAYKEIGIRHIQIQHDLVMQNMQFHNFKKNRAI